MITNLLSRASKSASKLGNTGTRLAGLCRNSLRRRFCEGGQQMRLFFPEKQLDFKKGLLLVAHNKFKGYYLFCGASAICLLILGGRAVWKIVDYKNRSFLGFMWWTAMLAGSSILLLQCHRSMRDVVNRIWLKSCGKKVIVRTGFPFMRPREFAIKDIERPEQLTAEYATSHFALVGFPINFGGEVLMVPRTIERHRPDLFGAIFNGMEICVDQNQPNEITIDIDSN